MKATIVVHGGAGRVAPQLQSLAVRGVTEAAQAGQRCLAAGGDAEAAVVEAVRVLEQCEALNAGRGACMTEDGQFELDAGIMRSRDGAHGAVAAVPDLATPIDLARAVMDHGHHRLLAAQGAVRFAEQHGVARFDRQALWTEKAQSRYDDAVAGRGEVVGQADTVGAVAIDASGHLCAGGSTGGVLLKASGRVGDSPLVGAGFYASAELGAAVATGVGEAIMTHVASLRALMAATQDGAQAAAQAVCDRVAQEQIGGVAASCGLILITPSGQVGIAHRCPHMSWAIGRPQVDVQAGLSWPPAPA